MKKTSLKLLCLGALFAASLLSCSKSKDSTSGDDEDIFNQFPSSPVPASLGSGVWFAGTLSAISFFDRDGHHLGNEYEAGREFKFYQNEQGKGRARFLQYLGMRTYSTCVTETYTQKDGTVVFEGDIFTFYPAKGSFKTIKAGCSSGNGTVVRTAEGEDLKPVSYKWKLKTIEGKPLLYTYDVDDEVMDIALFVYELAY